MELDMKMRQKLTETTAKRYCTASKKEKTNILDQFIANTGYNRKYAIHLLANTASVKIIEFNNSKKQIIEIIKKTPRKKRIYTKRYNDNVCNEIVNLWHLSMNMCAKRLVVFIHDNIEYFADKYSYSNELKCLLLSISASSIGRILKPEIAKCKLRGISTTRPATNLNQLIPIRTYFDWDERKPGFFEIDTVANCGLSASGEYISTLTLTDVCSGWTENRALLNKAHSWMKKAVDDVKKKLPFKMKGLDSDNGSEFKNVQMLSWCKENGIEFTRSRPYKKNDNCFVEQKNDSVVRKIVGYYRFEGEESVKAMAELYEVYNKLVNFFFPSMKIISKERIDAKVKKKYDIAKTPYTRLMESTDLDENEKKNLKAMKDELDLETLIKETLRLQSKLIDLAVRQS